MQVSKSLGDRRNSRASQAVENDFVFPWVFRFLSARGPPVPSLGQPATVTLSRKAANASAGVARDIGRDSHDNFPSSRSLLYCLLSQLPGCGCGPGSFARPDLGHLGGSSGRDDFVSISPSAESAASSPVSPCDEIGRAALDAQNTQGPNGQAQVQWGQERHKHKKAPCGGESPRSTELEEWLTEKTLAGACLPLALALALASPSPSPSSPWLASRVAQCGHSAESGQRHYCASGKRHCVTQTGQRHTRDNFVA